jgi:hypothetical protein
MYTTPTKPYFISISIKHEIFIVPVPVLTEKYIHFVLVNVWEIHFKILNQMGRD